MCVLIYPCVFRLCVSVCVLIDPCVFRMCVSGCVLIWSCSPQECVSTLSHSSLGHVLGERHEVLALLSGQQREDAPVAVHALLVLAQAHVEAQALPEVAHVGGVVLYGWKEVCVQFMATL